MTTIPPPPILDRPLGSSSGPMLARDNFAAFFTVTVIFGAVSLVMTS